MSMSVSDYAGMTGVGAMNAPAAVEQRSMNATLNNLYARMDPEGSGSVSRDQFRTSMDFARTPSSPKQISANDLFTKLDSTGKGTISREDFLAGMKKFIAEVPPKRAGADAGAKSSSGAPQNIPAKATASPAAGVNRPSPGANTGGLLNLYA
ncbi:MAG: EF-hand domain-containing protein [Nitrospinae bacterium]|nr:EF-hand domain-containing protein [Nitrospinota bacterium]